MIGKIISRYRVAEKIGARGFGEVYRAYDLRSGRGVAIKVLPTYLASDPGVRERFRHEVMALASVRMLCPSMRLANLRE